MDNAMMQYEGGSREQRACSAAPTMPLPCPLPPRALRYQGAAASPVRCSCTAFSRHGSSAFHPTPCFRLPPRFICPLALRFPNRPRDECSLWPLCRLQTLRQIRQIWQERPLGPLGPLGPHGKDGQVGQVWTVGHDVGDHGRGGRREPHPGGMRTCILLSQCPQLLALARSRHSAVKRMLPRPCTLVAHVGALPAIVCTPGGLANLPHHPLACPRRLRSR